MVPIPDIFSTRKIRERAFEMKPNTILIIASILLAADVGVLTGCDTGDSGSAKKDAPKTEKATEAQTQKQRPEKTKREESVRSSVTKQRFKLPSNKWVDDFARRLGKHERRTNRLLMRLVLLCPDDSVIVDAGAHVGDTGLVLGKYIQSNTSNKITVYEVDPDASKIDFIEQMAKLNDIRNIATFRVGLSDKRGQGKPVEEGQPGAWKVKEVSEGDFPLVTVDELVGSKKVCLIHLDVEGMELQAMKGATKVIESQKPPIVYEFIHGDHENILAFLQQHKYAEKWRAENNVLAVNDENAIFNEQQLREKKVLGDEKRKRKKGRRKKRDKR